jgi:sortase A
VSFSTIRVTVGRVILVAGILVLLFIPYLLWGTGLITAQAQDSLRQQFTESQQKHHDPTTVHNVVAPASPPVLAPAVPPPAVGAPVGIISIPKIGVSMVVVEGTDAAQLRSGPGHYPGTPLPGEAGNVAIAGHRTTYLHPFYDLDQLATGDPIDILTAQGLFRYRVVSSRSVDPTDVAVVAPTLTPTLTLTTCNPRYSATQRLVVQASLEADVLTGSTAPSPSTAAPHPATTIHHPAPTPVQKHWWKAVLLGILVAAVITALWAAAIRLRGGRRAALVVGGLIAWLGVVYLFFGALAPLLPASY